MPRDIRITRIEIEAFACDQHGQGRAPDGHIVVDPAAVTVCEGYALKVHTDAGVVRGPYGSVRHSVPRDDSPRLLS